MKYAKCPHCKVWLDEDDCIDMEDEVFRIVKRLVGSCPNCGREFQWSEYYEYVEANDPVEIM